MITEQIISVLSIDLFAYLPALTFSNSSRHKTWLGIALSYVTLAVMVLSFIFFGQELIIKENPNFIVAENKVKMDSDHELDFKNREKLQMGFGLFDTDKLIQYDKTYFKIFGEKKSYFFRKEVNYFDVVTVRFEVETCPIEQAKFEFGPGLPEEEYKFRSMLTLCLTDKIVQVNSTNPDRIPDAWKESHLNIKGLFGARNHSFVVVKFQKCKNSSTYNGNKRI